MKPVSSFSGPVLLLLLVMFSFSSCEAKTKNLSSDIHLVASTPGDEFIKSLLAIASSTKVDFIRWHLTFSHTAANRQTFVLNIHYGESKPNTLGFINDGEKKSIAGEYTISQENGNTNGDIYQLKSTALPNPVLLIKLSDNIFHLLSPQKQLLVGNGGWSYTLNRKEPLTTVSTALPVVKRATDWPEDTTQQMILEGRTPCSAITKEYNITVTPECFKLKWKLTLNKDPKTLQPTTYTLLRTGSRDREITGKWTRKKEGAVIYQLDPDKPEQTISLWMGDENVAFLLQKNNTFFTGNEDFSYTLNRRQNK
jgi:hypothetical protein